MQTTVTSKGQVTIPKAVRDLLGLHAGSKVSFRRTRDGRVELVPQREGPALIAGPSCVGIGPSSHRAAGS